MPETVQIFQREGGLWLGRFEAMKSPCEIFVQTDDWRQAQTLLHWAVSEVARIEQKYSRFLPHSVLSRLNRGAGEWQTIDDETRALLRFADECWAVTNGMVDVTVGAYLQYWVFDGATPPPASERLKEQRNFVGWDKLSVEQARLFLPSGMLLDLGGVAKEYAVDRVALALSQKLPEGGILVNLGGDIMAPRALADQIPWQVAIADVAEGSPGQRPVIELFQGAIATSGNTRRYAVDKDGKTLGHILNPKTGWPVAKGPSSVTVVANSAMQCGILSSYAMMQGGNAESFLRQQGVQYYLYR